MNKTKPRYRKLISMKKYKVKSQMKEQDKNPRKTTNWSGDRQLSRKRIQNNDSKDDSGSWKKNGGKDWEDARNVFFFPHKPKIYFFLQEMFIKDLEELKNKQTEMNNTLEWIHSRITEAEEQINDLEDRMVEITAADENIEKRMKRSEDSLRDHWDNTKCMNIQITGFPEGEEREKGSEKLFKEITAENFLNTGKEIVNQVQEAKPKEEHIETHSNQTDKN